uniref:Uncharacterized protein n=1 Tax=Rhizophora mucronata TaxID=61149 RepID=A0A2P2NMR0_RHIMU
MTRYQVGLNTLLCRKFHFQDLREVRMVDYCRSKCPQKSLAAEEQESKWGLGAGFMGLV